MSTSNTYLAVFCGSKTSPRRAAWDALPENDRRARERDGIAAWKAWVERHRNVIVAMAGPLGRTMKDTERWIDDTSNNLAAFPVVTAEGHDAAGRLFEGHSHVTIFPAASIEIMPVLPIPNG